jgi:hypothetical protein
LGEGYTEPISQIGGGGEKGMTGKLKRENIAMANYGIIVAEV